MQKWERIDIHTWRLIDGANVLAEVERQTATTLSEGDPHRYEYAFELTYPDGRQEGGYVGQSVKDAQRYVEQALRQW